MNLTTAQAAGRLKLSPQRVRAMIAAGQIKATLYGKTYVIAERDLKVVSKLRKPGRPAGSKNKPKPTRN